MSRGAYGASGCTIRPETPADIDAIRDVNRVAFEHHALSRQTEHLIVDALRDSGALTISLVASCDGEVVGHVAFSPARVGGATSGWYLLGPLAVRPTRQRTGVGSALVREGLARLAELGALGCVLVGDAGYYGRFGFRARSGLAYDGVPDEHVLGVNFGDVRPSGRIEADPAFMVTAEDGS